MAELPFLPLAIDAYLADCGHLEDAEHGRYLLILMELWRAPRQRLPNDDAWLARRFRRSADRVKSELRPLIAEFCQSDGNWVTQKRLTKEFLRARRVTKQKSDAAKSMWNKRKGRSERISGKPTRRISGAYEPTPTPTVDKKERESGPARTTTIPEDWEPSADDIAWAATARPDLTPDRITLETGSFKSHAIANHRTSFNWSHSWRGWITKAKSGAQANGARAHDDRPKHTTSYGRKSIQAAAFSDLGSRRPADEGDGS